MRLQSFIHAPVSASLQTSIDQNQANDLFRCPHTLGAIMVVSIIRSWHFRTLYQSSPSASALRSTIDCRYYNPPQFFSSLSDPLLVTLSMAKRPLPLNPSPLPDLPPLPPSEPSKPLLPLDQPPVEPLVPVPWNIHRQEYSSMEMYQEPPPVESPLEDPDSPMEDAPPLEPEPAAYYEPDVPGGNTHTLSPEESPVAPWEEYLTDPSSPVSRKHSLSPTSSSSAPICQRTSREGSYQSIMPAASSPIASTLPQSQSNPPVSLQESADSSSSMQSSADDADSDMALNWVTIKSDYLKG